MKSKKQKQPKVVKGAPSAVIMSILVHGGLFALAGLLVVFTVVKKEEKVFEPPAPVERPKMKLKKPKVRVKKSSKPKSSARIVTKVPRADMPDIRLPELSGMGDGFGAGGMGGFDLAPEVGDFVSPFGAPESIGSDLVGTLIDFNRTRTGSETGMESAAYIAELVRFNNSGWKNSTLAKYYRSPKKLYATSVAVPPLMSPLGPAAFNEPDNKAVYWVVLYRGQLVHKDGIKFRFVGNSDNIMAVRVDGKVVLDASRQDNQYTPPLIDTSWSADSADHRKWYHCHDYSAVGNLVELEPGEPKDLEIIIGESGGVLFNAILYVKEEGVDYPTARNGIPILPVFKTAPLTRLQQDMIYRGMPEDQVDVVGGPVFNDYSAPDPNSAEEGEVAEGNAVVGAATKPAEKEAAGPRVWTSTDGKTFEGDFVTILAGDVVITTPRGKQKKIPLELFSEEDQRYISLARPPKLTLDVAKKSRQRIFKYDTNGAVGCNLYTFSPKIKASSATYDHELRVDYWVIGSEISGSQYILLDKGSDSFNPARTPNGAFSFSGKEVPLYDWILEHIYRERRGERYEGFLITVTDERGEIVAHRSTPKWLYKNLEGLKKLEVGAFMDNTCAQTWPTPLKFPGN